MFIGSENVTKTFAVTGTSTAPFAGFVDCTEGAVESMTKTGPRTTVFAFDESTAVNSRRAVAVSSRGTDHINEVTVPGTGPMTGVHGAAPIAE